MENKSLEVYKLLHKSFGQQHWWPMGGGFRPREWEVCVGAILTQNTAWTNVEKALANLRKHKVVTAEKMLQAKTNDLAIMIKPSGYYNQKAARLRGFSEYVLSFGSVQKFLKNAGRHDLLKVKGIGPETADSILLYACGKPHFVVDAYTKRIFARVGLVKNNAGYDEIQKFFEKNMKKDEKLYNEFHALIVELAKRHCKKKPLCKSCPLEGKCAKRI